jgi:anti-anti-sigma factor
MSIEITPLRAVVRLSDDPEFTSLLDEVDNTAGLPSLTVLDFSAVTYINSSNLSRLLRTRRLAIEADRRVVIANISDRVTGVFEATSLTQLFEIRNEGVDVVVPPGAIGISSSPGTPGEVG